jgi:hypothetical protein
VKSEFLAVLSMKIVVFRDMKPCITVEVYRRFVEKYCFYHLSLSSVVPTSERRASVKRFVSLQFLNPLTVGRTPWTGDQPVARPLPTQTQNKLRQTSMPSAGFETTIPAFGCFDRLHEEQNMTRK